MVIHIDILRAVRILTLILAGVVAYISTKSYRRTGDRVMLALSVGFVLIALGALLSGILFELFNFAIEVSYIVESVFVAVGLAAVVYSIYGVKRSASHPKKTKRG
jgi:cyanate permease